MTQSDVPKVVAQLLAVAFVLLWLAADLIFDFQVSRWPPLARYGALALVVGMLTLTAFRITFPRRQ